MADRFEIAFDLSALNALDDFALLARQAYNLGNRDKWFSHFRGGAYAAFNRLFGVQRHYYAVHAWTGEPVLQSAEYHLASIFFGMDSAVECFVFALNALGWGAGGDFRDISDSKILRRIGPNDVSGKEPLDGYHATFPSVQEVFINRREMIEMVVEQHDVSKHRETVFVGGRVRGDPPDGFFEARGLAAGSPAATLLTPMDEILLREQPKRPAAERTTQAYDPENSLEHLTEKFSAFMKSVTEAALRDANERIPLRVSSLQGTSEVENSD